MFFHCVLCLIAATFEFFFVKLWMVKKSPFCFLFFNLWCIGRMLFCQFSFHLVTCKQYYLRRDPILLKSILPLRAYFYLMVNQVLYLLNGLFFQAAFSCCIIYTQRYMSKTALFFILWFFCLMNILNCKTHFPYFKTCLFQLDLSGCVFFYFNYNHYST